MAYIKSTIVLPTKTSQVPCPDVFSCRIDVFQSPDGTTEVLDDVRDFLGERMRDMSEEGRGEAENTP
jgi:hypothetical protein